jgi:mRNA-degrading endonuclease toxin of MazEF toxin-antitoxin module
VALQPESPPSRTSPRQRALILGGAALGLVGLVVAVALGTPFGGRAGTPPPAVVLAPPGATTTTTRAGGGAAAAAPATTTTTTPTATALALTAKDPFKPLVGSGATATTSPVGATATTAAGGGGSPGGGASTGRKLTLLSVFRSGGVRYVKVDLDGRTYQAAEGGTIAGAYRVVDVGTSCAEFRSTSGTAFTLCEGEAVLK